MVACQVAHSLFNVPTKIARVRQQDYLQTRWRDLFRPRPPADRRHHLARGRGGPRHLRRLEVPGASSHPVRRRQGAADRRPLRRPDCPIIDTPIRQLTYLFPGPPPRLRRHRRGDRFFVPEPATTTCAGDEVYFVVETGHVGRAMPAFGHEEPPVAADPHRRRRQYRRSSLAQELEAAPSGHHRQDHRGRRRAGASSSPSSWPARRAARRRARPRHSRGGQGRVRRGDRHRHRR